MHSSCGNLTLLVAQRAAKMMEEDDEATADTESVAESEGPSKMIVNGIVHAT